MDKVLYIISRLVEWSRPIRRALILIAHPTLFFAQSAGLPNQVHCEHISFSEGFNLSFINQFCTDRRGMVWVSGMQGLVRFSGASHKRYYEADSVSANGLGPGGITTIVTDADQRLWAAGPSGLYWYHEVRDSFCLTTPPAGGSWQPVPRVVGISTDKKTMWLYDMYGLWQRVLPDGNWQKHDVPPCQKPELLFATRMGLLLLQQDEVAVLYDPVQQQVRSSGHTRPLSAFESDDGAIWYGTWRNGLHRINPNTGHETVFFPENDHIPGVYGEVFTALTTVPDITGDSILWCATLDNGIWFFSLTQHRFVHHIVQDDAGAVGLPGYGAVAMYVDRGGVLWLSMDGITRITPYRQQMLGQKVYGLHASDSRELYIRNRLHDRYRPGYSWLMLAYYGLVSYNDATQKVEKWWFYPDKKPIIKRERNFHADMVYDRLGRLWASTETGFMVVDQNRRTRTINVPIYNNNNTAVNAFWFDESNTCWMATGLGLCALNPGQERVQTFDNQYNNKQKDIRDLTPDDVGLWLATTEGIAFFDFKTHNFRTFILNSNPDEYAACNFFTCILKTRTGRILAINEKGLTTLHNGQLRQLCDLPNTKLTHVRSMVEDVQGIVWVKCLSQVIKIDPANGTILGRFDSDGAFFVESDAPYLTMYSKQMYRFEPTSLRQFNYTQPPVITALKIFDKPYHINFDSAAVHPVQLTWKQNALTFDYDCPDFTSYTLTSYEVMLEGYDTSWKPQGHKRSVTYTNLAPGDYVFSVRSSNMNGVKHPKDTVIRFRINPPFWQTWWFKLLVISLLASTVYLIFRARVRNVREVEQRKTAFYKMKAETEMRALRAQMNPHFIFNCMNTIEAFIIEQREVEATEFLQKFSKLIRAVLENAQHDSIELRYELEVLEWYIQLEQIRANHRWNYHIETDENVNTTQHMVPPLIIQPFVENAIVHGLHHRRQAGGILRLQIEKNTDDHLVIRIIDNGIGRLAAATKRKHFNGKKSSLGVQFTTDRITKLNQVSESKFGVDITDLDPEQTGMTGTKVVLTLP
jgi:ligand-binding sensor domain-containing protein